ncbi:MAG: metallophosphoesterase [Polyangiaceae bacterium]
MFFWLVRIVYDGATLLLPVVLVVGAAWTFRENRRRAAWTVALAVLAVATRIYATHVEPQRLQIHQEAVATDAPDAPPIRVLHLSDIQTDAVGAWEARVIDEVLALEPDLVVHTGDLLHPIAPATVRSELPKITSELARFGAVPLVTVDGDTDGGMGGEEVAGMQLLMNRALRLEVKGRTVSIFGLALFRSAEGARGLIEPWLAEQPADAVTIVIGHRPDFALELAGLDVDLALAGHTHGGQIRLPFIGPLLTLSNVPREWARGFRTVHDWIHLNVSAGIGAEHAAGLPSIRFLCPPEMTLIEVH